MTRVGRSALRLLVLGLLLFAGLAAAILAVRPRAVPAATSTAATGTTSTTGTSGTTTSVQLTTTSAARSVLAFSGHGWGHGLGMSQWGAYGYAKHGWTFDRILAHYYSGTTIGPAPVASVRVLLAQRPRVTLASPVSWSVTDGAGTSVLLEPGPLVLAPDLSVAGQQLVSPLTFKSAQPVVVGKKRYRGRIVVTTDGKKLLVVNVLALESYLKGVVPSEMPSSWPAQALQAQAVAARSYALANRANGRPFDLYSDTRSQVYGGVGAESPAASAAIQATRGQVVLYNGKVADTLFFSTSGGRTASAADTTGTAVPYLVSVSDPYDTASPYHNWGPVLFDASKVAKQLKLSAAIADLETATGSSGRITTVTVFSRDESQATFTGSQFRGELELRSTWFTPTLLQLQPPPKPITFGGAASLTGFVRGSFDSVSLESKAPEGAWAPVGELIPDSAGLFSAVVSPQVTTQYRLAWDNVRAGLARVAVAPLVEAEQPAADGFQGAIRPAIAAVAIELQQQQPDLTWATLSSTVTDGTGAWSFAGQLQPGTYRARSAPGFGFVAGFSTTLTVP